MGRRTKAELAAIQNEIAEKLQDLPSEFLACRDSGLRHQWHLVTDFHVVPAEQVRGTISHIQRKEECLRCGGTKTEKFALLEDGITKVGEAREYPEGYLLEGGIPRGVKRSSVVWGEGFRRAGVKAVEEGNVTPIKKKSSGKPRGRQAKGA